MNNFSSSHAQNRDGNFCPSKFQKEMTFKHIFCLKPGTVATVSNLLGTGKIREK